MSNFYFLKQACSQLNRNKGMSFTSIFSIIATLLVLSVFMTVTINVNIFIKAVEENYNYVEVYLTDDITQSDLETIKSKALAYDYVKDVTYKTKDQALSDMKEDWGENGYLLDSIGNNPLPNSYSICTCKPLTDDNLINDMKSCVGVESVKYYKEIAEKIIKITTGIQYASLIIMAILLLASIVIVSNTVKLTVMARSKEIEIMKYIGATDWFIRGPFLIEGILMGVLSSIVCTGITYVVYSKLVTVINDSITSILSVSLYPPMDMLKISLVAFVVIGMIVGSLGSVISMKKYLKC